MAFNESGHNTVKPNGLPPYPKECQSCGGKTDQVRLKASSGRGVKLYSALSICTQHETRGHKSLTINDSYQFISWWTRCNECFASEMRDDRARRRMNGEHPYYC